MISLLIIFIGIIITFYILIQKIRIVSLSRVLLLIYYLLFFFYSVVFLMKGLIGYVPNYVYLYIFIIFLSYFIFLIYRIFIFPKRLISIIILFELYLLYSVGTYFWSINPERSLVYALNQFIFINTLFIIPILLYKNNLVYFNIKFIKKIFDIMIFFIFILSFVNFVYFYSKVPFFSRFGGMFFNANNIGNLLFIGLLIVHIYNILFSNKYKFIFYFLLILLLLTQSRGFLIGLLVYIYMYNFILKKYKRIFLISVVLLPVLIIIFVVRTSSLTGGAEEGISAKNISRPLIWITSIDYAIENKKIFQGTGFETGYDITKNTIVGELWDKKYHTIGAGSSLHSGIIKIFVTNGIVGFVIFILLLKELIKFFQKTNIYLKSLGISYVIAPVITDLFNVNYWGAIGGISTAIYFTGLWLLIILSYDLERNI